MAFAIEFARSVKQQLLALPVHQRAAILDAIATQLAHEPMVETRNRKALRPNPLAPWELRVGDARVFYDVTTEGGDVVSILAVGLKEGNRLLVGGKEIQL